MRDNKDATDRLSGMQREEESHALSEQMSRICLEELLQTDSDVALNSKNKSIIAEAVAEAATINASQSSHRATEEIHKAECQLVLNSKLMAQGIEMERARLMNNNEEYVNRVQMECVHRQQVVCIQLNQARASLSMAYNKGATDA